MAKMYHRRRDDCAILTQKTDGVLAFGATHVVKTKRILFFCVI
jgi:hypothetical protein